MAILRRKKSCPVAVMHLPFFLVVPFFFFYQKMSRKTNHSLFERYSHCIVFHILDRMCTKKFDHPYLRHAHFIEKKQGRKKFKKIILTQIRSFRYSSSQRTLFDVCCLYEDEIEKQKKQRLWETFLKTTNAALDISQKHNFPLLTYSSKQLQYYLSLITCIKSCALTVLRETLRQESELILLSHSEKELKKRYQEIRMSHIPSQTSFREKQEIIHQMNEQLAHLIRQQPLEKQKKIKEIMPYEIYRNVIIRENTRQFIQKELKKLLHSLPQKNIETNVSVLFLRANHLLSEGRQVSQTSAMHNTELIELIQNTLQKRIPETHPYAASKKTVKEEIEKMLISRNQEPTGSHSRNIHTIKARGFGKMDMGR